MIITYSPCKSIAEPKGRLLVLKEIDRDSTRAIQIMFGGANHFSAFQVVDRHWNKNVLVGTSLAVGASPICR